MDSDTKHKPSSKVRTVAGLEAGLPAGIPYIVGNEFAERFSFYGMKAILTVFMTTHLLDAGGGLAPMSGQQATAAFHLFAMTAYIFPMLGALLADAIWGKYRTILVLSIVYCLGHLALAVDETRLGLGLGLGLIAIGSGGIKPCVSAHVGDQFGANNRHLRDKVFGGFYLAINLGAFLSSLLTPWLLVHHGPALAFGVPGLLMAIATLLFWLGRHRFVHIPPAKAALWQGLRSASVRATLLRLAGIYLFVAMFWALFDQTASSWVLQAQAMDLDFLGVVWLPAQLQAINPIMILILVPSFSFGVYPMAERFFRVTPLRKIGAGLFVAALSFAVVAWAQFRIDAGMQPSIGWQVLAYGLLTAAEVMVSVTCLEFSYAQAPKAMKSVVMALNFLSVALGNLFTAGINGFLAGQNTEGGLLAGAGYFVFFSVVMACVAMVFVWVVRRSSGSWDVSEAASI